MHFADEPGQPLAAQFGGRHRLALGAVVVLPSDAENAATTVDRDPGVGETIDHREEPFGRGRSSSRNFAA